MNLQHSFSFHIRVEKSLACFKEYTNIQRVRLKYICIKMVFFSIHMCKRPKLYYTDMQEGISCYILNFFRTHIYANVWEWDRERFSVFSFFHLLHKSCSSRVVHRFPLLKVTNDADVMESYMKLKFNWNTVYLIPYADAVNSRATFLFESQRLLVLVFKNIDVIVQRVGIHS